MVAIVVATNNQKDGLRAKADHHLFDKASTKNKTMTTTTTTTPANVAGAAVQGLEPPDLAAVADVVPTVLPLHLMVTATAAVSDFNAPSNPRNQEHRDVMLRDLVVRRLTF